MQHQILIIVMIFFAYALNLPLNTQRPHHRSQRTGKLGLCRRILDHGSRPIYRAPTYIAVPFHGPHQPRYIGLTLYCVVTRWKTAGRLFVDSLWRSGNTDLPDATKPLSEPPTISKVPWHSSKVIIIRRPGDTSHENDIENCFLKIKTRDQWIKSC